MPDIVVSTQAQLDAALKAAKGGETIKLAAGTYTSIALNNTNYASNVTITSLDAKNPATVQRVALNSDSNITFKNLNLSRDVASTEVDWTQLHNVNKSKNIVFDNVTISGGSGDVTKSVGWGLFVRDSANVTVQNSSFDHVGLGLNVTASSNVVVKDNSFHDIRRDGMNLSALTGVVVDGNMFTNMFPVNGEHPDAIQFLTRGTTVASSNIVVKNNVVMQGAGDAIQGVFMNDEEGNLPYTNVQISNNLIYVNGQYQGISITGGKNVSIQSNTIVSRTDDAIPAWVRLDRVDGANVSGNVGDRLVTTSTVTNLNASNNSWLQTDSVTLRKFANLNGVSTTKLSELIVDGYGYHPPVGSVAAGLVASELAAAGATASVAKSSTSGLLLDLEFGATGMSDKSRWDSVATSKAVDTSSISGAMYHVQTGKGFELNRSNSVQLYALPAFTLSFDMKRDSRTATAGQIIGVYQSWSMSLRSDGELVFTIKNDAGKTFTLATSGAKITDTATHKIALTYDGKSGKATIYVDSVARGSTAVSGASRAIESWGLYVGSPFSTAFSGSIGSIEMRDQALSAAQVLALNTGAAAPQPSNLASATVAPMVASVSADGSKTALASSMVPAMPETPSAAPQITVANLANNPSAPANLPVATAALGNTGTLSRNSLALAKFSTMDLYHV